MRGALAAITLDSVAVQILKATKVFTNELA